MPEFEKLREPFVDKNYKNRKGYNPDYLGVEAPIPKVADDSYLAKMENGKFEIPYTHFSIILHKERKLALLTASNVDASEKAKKPEEGKNYGRKDLGEFNDFDIEKWVLDPRIPEQYQLPDKFYTKDRKNFDKGHIVRRDDVVWGKTYEELKRANGDTYHTTNCSPQVAFFNRSNRKGDWGKFENNVLKQAKLEKLCILSGPVLDNENDKIFNGYISDKVMAPVQIPSKFYKIVIAEKDGKLQTFAFLLEQDLSQSDVEFNVDAEWVDKQISMVELQKMLSDIEFQEVYFETDQFEKTGKKEDLESKKEDDSDKKPTKKPRAKATRKKRPKTTSGAVDEVAPDEWDKEKSPEVLLSALKNKNYKVAEKVLDGLNEYLDKGSRIDSKSAGKVLRALKIYAWFDQMDAISSKFLKYAQDDIGVLLCLAQAKIERGDISVAIHMTKDLIKRIEEARKDMTSSTDKMIENAKLHSEALGLMGRAYKQFYVDAGPLSTVTRSADRDMSMNYYKQGSNIPQGDTNWHKINMVALLTKQERVLRDNSYAISEEAGLMAREVLESTLESIRNKDENTSIWHYSNLVEASLAVGESAEAIEYLKTYLTVCKEPFQIQSTLRQFTEMYMLTTESVPGEIMIPLMKARYIELGGKGEETKLDLADLAHYEKVYGETPYKSVRWLMKALTVSKSIVRLGPDKYNGTGTGFIFEGSWISDKLSDKRYIMTNAHVCTDDEEVQQQIPYPDPPEDLVATFIGEGTAETATEIACNKVVWTSPPYELDATLIEIESFPVGRDPLTLSKRKPPVSPHGDSRLNILGHPKGLDMRVSLQDNEYVDMDDVNIWYKTPTDGGSSGSPVFNQEWKLVGLHHASSSSKKANEGIRIDVILEKLKEDLG